MEKTTAGSDDDPIITTLDRNCATFVRDVLFPLRRDWGSGHNHRQHSTIHPALYALDRLRTDLIEKRQTTMSYSGIFPRGVLLVPNKTSSATTNGSIVDNNNNNHGSMEWNGQPNIVESTVEVIPNVLSVKCVRCDAYSPNNNSMKKYTPSSANNSKAFMRQIMKLESTGGGGGVQHELVVCSDRILQNDYYRQFGGGRGDDESLLKEQQQQRREDMPIQSTRAIEETLIREITKLKVNTDDENNTTASNTNDVLTYSSLSSNRSSSSSSSSSPSSMCDEYAKFELMAAKVSECMLLRNQKETRMGSALRPSSLFLFSMLPTGTQHNFVNRCIQSVAMKYTTDAVNVFNSEQQKSNRNDAYANVVPKECVERAWKNINTNHSQQ
jgi:hypothetical protein